MRNRLRGMGSSMTENVLAVGILEGEQLDVGIGVDDVGHGTELAVDVRRDVGAGDQFGGGSGVIHRHGRVEGHGFVFEIDLHGITSKFICDNFL